MIVNTGSKQGITQPPGNTAYNVSKAGVKALTEGLAHTLREITGERVTAHLLIPGYTHTGMTARGQEKPAAAWSAEQVVDYMLAGLDAGDFYLLCPDNETTREQDAKRIAWAAGGPDREPSRPVALASGMVGCLRALHGGVRVCACLGVDMHTSPRATSLRGRHACASIASLCITAPPAPSATPPAAPARHRAEPRRAYRAAAARGRARADRPDGHAPPRAPPARPRATAPLRVTGR